MIKESIIKRFFSKTVISRKLNSRATHSMPDGDTRDSIYFEPYPIYIKHGEGYTITDVDGNTYIDFLNNYTSLIHGHNNAKVRESVTKQLQSGTIFGSPHRTQVELAEILCNRIPSIEKIRFCNSGTEATLFAIRAARAYTGKDKIIKMEGGYHGTHDLAEASVSPSLEEAGDPISPKVIPHSLGIPQNVFESVIIVPFNNKEAIKAAVHNNKNNIAAIIVEPIMNAAGAIPATKEYLQFLRDITESEGILLIFDEVASFRISQGGAQEYYAVCPDLTTLGKLIGGGFPIGAFGGKEDIMSLFSPKGGSLHHAGTFNGHPITMIAGLVTLKDLNNTVFNKINALGDLLRQGIDEAFLEVGIKGRTSGLGSLVAIHYTTKDVENYRDVRIGLDHAKVLPHLMHICLLNHGIFMAPRGHLALSTPMTKDEINQTIGVFKKSCKELKPFVLQELPDLIADEK